MKKLILLAFTAGILLAFTAACGGSSEAANPASQIRANYEQMFDAMGDDNYAKYCSYATKPGECLGTVAMAQAFVGEGKLSDLYSDEAVDDVLENMAVEMSMDGEQATVTYDGSDGPQSDPWVKDGDDWKLVYEDEDASS